MSGRVLFRCCARLHPAHYRFERHRLGLNGRIHQVDGWLGCADMEQSKGERQRDDTFKQKIHGH